GDHALPGVRVRTRVRRVERGERDAGGAHALVVAADAVLVDHGTRRVRRRCRGRGRLRSRWTGGEQRGERCANQHSYSRGKPCPTAPAIGLIETHLKGRYA